MGGPRPPGRCWWTTQGTGWASTRRIGGKQGISDAKTDLMMGQSRFCVCGGPLLRCMRCLLWTPCWSQVRVYLSPPGFSRALKQGSSFFSQKAACAFAGACQLLPESQDTLSLDLGLQLHLLGQRNKTQSLERGRADAPLSFLVCCVAVAADSLVSLLFNSFLPNLRLCGWMALWGSCRVSAAPAQPQTLRNVTAARKKLHQVSICPTTNHLMHAQTQSASCASGTPHSRPHAPKSDVSSTVSSRHTPSQHTKMPTGLSINTTSSLVLDAAASPYPAASRAAAAQVCVLVTDGHGSGVSLKTHKHHTTQSLLTHTHTQTPNTPTLRLMHQDGTAVQRQARLGVVRQAAGPTTPGGQGAHAAAPKHRNRLLLLNSKACSAHPCHSSWHA